ncbi:aldehyde:ferredoxin oxidoreductase [miscellaneous Crenarchaeota group archaeon SMTZ1-55]|nr:MAG: aldehyde:ferredoxin oxidoreductase [miscellaneous Crenarchaeota group archaeon SMTZ1-55]
MSRGYAGKWLDVDLTQETIDEITFPEKTLRQYIGGRGLAAKVLWDRLGTQWADVDPLGPQNVLTILTGPLTAIHPGTRICVSGKSPISNGVVGSTASSEFAAELKCAGYDGLLISGKASSPVYLLVTDDGAEIRDAAHLWGKVAEDTLKILNQEVAAELTRRKSEVGLWKEPAMVYIGPAGENLVRNAAVVTKLVHAAGYGGYGAVMGSKNLKAVAAKGRGPLPEVAAPKTVEILWREYHRRLIAMDRMRRWGTGYAGWETGAVTSSEPVRNWQEEWHDERSMAGPRYSSRFWVKAYWADFNCSRSCMKISCIKSGRWKGDITDMPDYELEAYCGTNLGLFDPGDNIHISALIDNLGMSGINTANTLGFAAELYQRGILTEEDLGFALEWGDAEAFTKLAWLIVNREKIGDVLAEGTYRAAQKISEMKGVDVMPYAVHVKGIEIGAHGTRSNEDYTKDMCYAASTQGGDHTSVVRDAYNDMGTVFMDSAVVCMFCVVQDLVWDYARAVTGWDITQHTWSTEQGPRIQTLQRALLLLGGPDVFWDPDTDDDNPPRFYEPLPTGPYKGRTTDAAVVEQNKQDYFSAIGWDARGIPTTQTLERLDLQDLEAVMKPLRK